MSDQSYQVVGVREYALSLLCAVGLALILAPPLSSLHPLVIATGVSLFAISVALDARD